MSCKVGIWEWLIHRQAGEGDLILVSMQSMDSPWRNVAVELLKNAPQMSWGNVLMEQNAMAGVVMQTFKRQGETTLTETVEWNAFWKYNETLRVVNQEFMAKCVNQRVSVVAYKEALITCSGRVNTIKLQTEEFIVRVTELQTCVNIQPRQVC